MSNLIEKKFINEELRIEIVSYIDKNLVVWFYGKEVAQILGYQKPRNAIEKHVSKKYKKEAPIQGPLGGKQKCIFIKEAGFYELVFKSRLPAAKIFRQWVFDKVLPSIRKYCYYSKIDLRIKQRVVFDGKKYYKHQVFSNYAANKNGEIINVKTGKNIRMVNNGNGYLFFAIFNKKLEKRKNYYQHRFVYEVFKGTIPKCLEVDHRNSIRNDNRIKNLQLLTPTQNKQKSSNKPIISTCINTGKEKRFISIKEASEEKNIFASNISAICKGKNKTATSKKDGKKYKFRYLD